MVLGFIRRQLTQPVGVRAARIARLDNIDRTVLEVLREHVFRAVFVTLSTTWWMYALESTIRSVHPVWPVHKDNITQLVLKASLEHVPLVAPARLNITALIAVGRRLGIVSLVPHAGLAITMAVAVEPATDLVQFAGHVQIIW